MKRPIFSNAIGRAAALAVVLGVTLTSAQPAAAQNLFEALFGSFLGQSRQTSAYADPSAPPPSAQPQSAAGFGHGTVYCVRTCDGRYFPLQRHAGTSAAELCQSFCPASKTMLFSGGKIDSAVSANGTRYADLDNAFAYREKLVDGCTCNGKDSLGLAHLDTASDPTLRPGDVVATESGYVSFRGKSGSAAQFTAINPSSSEWARKLTETKVRPAPPSQAVVAVAHKDASNDKALSKREHRQAAR